MDMKHNIRKSTEDILRSKERKRNNRVNANRNDYGNEGFLLMTFYGLGCEIQLKRPQKDGLNQKLKVMSISYLGQELLNRESIENMINNTPFPPEANLLRIKRTILNITIDNMLLDILRDYFKYEFLENVKKKPEKDFMPERRVLEHIDFSESYDKQQIIEHGVQFYESIKQANVGINTITLCHYWGDVVYNTPSEYGHYISSSYQESYENSVDASLQFY
ncbi:Uncharacterized protein QTN25_000210 [Entamoeba marina]